MVLIVKWKKEGIKGLPRAKVIKFNAKKNTLVKKISEKNFQKQFERSIMAPHLKCSRYFTSHWLIGYESAMSHRS